MAEFERIKAHLIRSLFHDPPDLTTIQEEDNVSSTAGSPLLSPESYQSYSPCPPPAHCDGVWSPLPPLNIEIVKNKNKYDDSEEFYKRLEKKILKIYRRIFFEDRSDISDIITSDDDDEDDTQTAPIDYSANNVELVELTHTSINDISSDDYRLNNNDPIDFSTKSVELVASTSVNNIAADQENPEFVATAGTVYRRSNEEMDSQDNEPSDDDSRNDNHDDTSYSNEDDDHYRPNLETIFESDEDNLSNIHANENISSNLEANVETDGVKTPYLQFNIENDEGHVSSSTDVMANSTESDGNHDSVTPLSSTVILSRGTSDEEFCLERNDVPANTTYHIRSDTEEIEGSRPSPRPSTGSIPKAAVSTNASNQNFWFESAKNEEGEHSGSQPLPTTEANSNAKNMDTARATQAVTEDTEAPEFHEKTPKLYEGTSQLNEQTPEPYEKSPELHQETPELTEGTPKLIEKTPELHERTITLHQETPELHEQTLEAHKGTLSRDMEDNASMDIDSDNNQNEVEEMRTPRPHRSTGSPAHHHKNVQPYEPDIIIVEHRASIPSDIYSDKEEEMPARPNINIGNTNNLDLFDLVRISSPKDTIEGTRKIINPEDCTANISSEYHSGDCMPSGDNFRMNSPEDHSNRNSSEDHLEKNSPERNNRKRKSITPCQCRGKRVKYADKFVQTDDFNSNELTQNIDININPDNKNNLIGHVKRTVVQNIKININTLLSI